MAKGNCLNRTRWFYLKAQRGITLIEVLIAFTLLSVMGTAMAASLVHSMRLSSDGTRQFNLRQNEILFQEYQSVKWSPCLAEDEHNT